MAIDVIEFVKETAKQVPGEIEAVAVFCTSKGQTVAGFAGIDSLGISPDTILLIDAITRSVDERFSLAKKICENMRKDGILGSKIVRERTEKVIHEEDRSEPTPPPASGVEEEADDFIAMLAKLLSGDNAVTSAIRKSIEEDIRNAHGD